MGGDIKDFAGAFVGGAIGFFVGGPAGLVLGASIGYGAQAAVEGFTSYDMPSAVSQYDRDRPAVTVKEGIPISRPYGRCLIAGNVLRANDPAAEAWLKAVIAHGRGPIDGILATFINDIEFGCLSATHYKAHATGTWSQTPIQVGGGALFSTKHCAYRGIAHTGVKLNKGDKAIQAGANFLFDGRWLLCEPIGEVAAGLTARWALDETSGSTAEDSVGSNDGTVTGASWATGMIGNCLDFGGAGSGDHVALDSQIDLAEDTAWTIAYWFYHASTYYVNSMGEDGVYNNSVNHSDGTEIVLRLNDGTSVTMSFGSDYRGAWHWVAIVCTGADSDNLLFYVDGAYKATYTAANSRLLVDDIGRGGENDNRCFDGLLDEIRIYNGRALSADEIEALYYFRSTGYPKAFSRSPATIMWDWYRNVEGYGADEMSAADFLSLETLCAAYPSSGDGAPMRPPGPNTDTVKATSDRLNIAADHVYAPWFATDIDLPLTGRAKDSQWLSASGNVTNQCLNVDLGVKVLLTKIRLVNAHDGGSETDQGIQNFAIQGSNDPTALSNVTYADDTGWTNVQTGLTASAYNAATPHQEHAVSSPSTAYRYYRLKIADNHGDASYMGIRDVEFWARQPRYTFDYNFDAEISQNDAKKQIWRSFHGRVIRSQGKLKPVWDWSEMADGAGGLTAKTTQHSFTADNIVPGSLSRRKPERPNLVTIHFLDATENWKRSSVTEPDEADIDERGEVPYEETCWWIISEESARRRALQKLNHSRYADDGGTLTGWSDSSHVEVYDLVDVTDTQAGYDGKEFIVKKTDEDFYGRPTFELKAYHPGSFDDGASPTQSGYFSRLPKPWDRPVDVENVAVTDVSYWDASGHYVIQVNVTYDLPNNHLFWSHARVQTSTDGGSTYADYPGTDQTVGAGFIVAGAIAGLKVGDTVHVRVISVSVHGVESREADADSDSVTITVDLEDAVDNLPTNGGRLVLPEGTYTLTGALSLPDKDIDIEGINRDRVVIKNYAGANGIVIYNKTKTFRLSNFTISSQNSGSYSNMIYVYGSAAANNTSHVTVDNVKIVLADDGDVGTACSGDSGVVYWRGEDGRAVVQNCAVSGGEHAIVVDTYESISVLSNLLTDQGDRAIEGDDVTEFTITGNQIFGAGGAGVVVMATSARGKISGNVVVTKDDSVASQNLRGITSSASFTSVTDNTIKIDSSRTGGTAVGIVSDGTQSVVANNEVEVNCDGNTYNGAGIEVTGAVSAATDCSIANNTIKVDIPNPSVTWDNWGIDVWSVDRSMITGNVIDLVNNTADDVGIYLDANSDDNQICDNITYNVGTSISDNGAGNTTADNKDV